MAQLALAIKKNKHKTKKHSNQQTKKKNEKEVRGSKKEEIKKERKKEKLTKLPYLPPPKVLESAGKHKTS